MIATFFVVLRRSNPRAEMRWGTYGWFGNVWAMAVTMAVWWAQPGSNLHGPILAGYLLGKNAYVWLIGRGALEFRSGRPQGMQTTTPIPSVIQLSIGPG